VGANAILALVFVAGQPVISTGLTIETGISHLFAARSWIADPLLAFISSTILCAVEILVLAISIRIASSVDLALIGTNTISCSARAVPRITLIVVSAGIPVITAGSIFSGVRHFLAAISFGAFPLLALPRWSACV
jgi:hypothetical protein